MINSVNNLYVQSFGSSKNAKKMKFVEKSEVSSGLQNTKLSMQEIPAESMKASRLPLDLNISHKSHSNHATISSVCEEIAGIYDQIAQKRSDVSKQVETIKHKIVDLQNQIIDIETEAVSFEEGKLKELETLQLLLQSLYNQEQAEQSKINTPKKNSPMQGQIPLPVFKETIEEKEPVISNINENLVLENLSNDKVDVELPIKNISEKSDKMQEPIKTKEKIITTFYRLSEEEKQALVKPEEIKQEPPKTTGQRITTFYRLTPEEKEALLNKKN